MKRYSVEVLMFGTAYVEASSQEEAVAKLAKQFGSPVKSTLTMGEPKGVYFNSSDDDIPTETAGVTLSPICTSWGFVADDVSLID